MPQWQTTEPIRPEATSKFAGLVSLLQTPTFAVTELLGTSDSAAWKKHMVGLGFKDVTPVYGNRKGVVTFDKLTSEDWLRYQDEFSQSYWALAADWQYFSGHHSAHIHPNYISGDFMEVLNSHDDCGFFNEAYHQGTFEGHDERPNSIFMRMSKNPSSPTPDRHDNPFVLPKSMLTKGVIANGCNTFTYRHTRMWLRKMFPKAVIVGYFDKTPIGAEAVFPLFGGGGAKGLYQDDDAFWKDPMKRFLNPDGNVDHGKVESDMRALNAIYYQTTKRRYGKNRGKHSLGLMIGDMAYRCKPLDEGRFPKLTDLQRVQQATIQRLNFRARWG